MASPGHLSTVPIVSAHFRSPNFSPPGCATSCLRPALKPSKFGCRDNFRPSRDRKTN